MIASARAERALFPPESKAAAVHLACQKPGRLIPLRGIPSLESASEASFLVCPVAEAAQHNAGLRRVLLWDRTLGWCLKVPVGRFSGAIIAWLLIVLGLVSKISGRTVQRWFKSDEIKPWRFRSWITPKNLTVFMERAIPVLDLYSRVANGELAEGEAVYSCDEKTSIQARRRDHYRAAGAGEPAHVQNTYTRCGAVQLFAALNVAVGHVFAQVREGKFFQDFSEFLNGLVNHAMQRGYKLVHLILDNGSSHRPKYLETWLKNQGFAVEIIVHWLPVRSSWLNQVENFFSQLQRHALMPNNFDGTAMLAGHLLDYINWRNHLPSPIKWTYTANDLRKKYGLPPAQPDRALAAVAA